MGTEVPMVGTLPDLTLCIPSSGCSSVSFKLINVSKYFLKLCESSQQIIKLRERVVGTLILMSFGSTGDNLDFSLVSEVGSVCGTEPSPTFGI